VRGLKKLLIALGVILIVAIPLTVLAATTDTSITNTVRGFCRITPDDLSEQQKTELFSSFKQMMEAKKKIVNELVESGKLTKEEAEAIIQRLDEKLEYKEENGFFTSCSGMKRGLTNRKNSDEQTSQRAGSCSMGKGKMRREQSVSGSCPYLPKEAQAN
jgi:polyhydroxyalkanoate synthesis regulator phasin